MAIPTPGAAVPLDQPIYGATFRQSVSRLFRKYATFTGRASRSEFWWTQLFTNVVVLAATVPLMVTLVGQIASTIGYAVSASSVGSTGSSTMPIDIIGWMLGSIVAMLPLFVIAFALMVPTYALGARRLHDAGLSGWFMALAPVTGGVAVLVIGFLPSKVEGLRYEQPGSVPLLAPGLVVPAPGFGAAPQAGAPYGVVGQPFGYAPSGQPR
ncbi:DUF805 domain-containing protein [Agrococcus jejuensis]|uniref:Uncharacterized membrane protein YhaH, DUF805 family n=1 Tax=Agrococcus jejuensis TaxID=399736 RepID=A0A1G8CUH0_9MICO|nr:DUF805 domain-containing protein [Agrococcus jejuensis]SDH48914.1 Uncharacterized membrane protein YhaH, DUF805 family [Agrococcus jejuensis]